MGGLYLGVLISWGAYKQHFTVSLLHTYLFSLASSCSLFEMAAFTSSNCSLARVSSSPIDAAACSPARERALNTDDKNVLKSPENYD